MKRICKSCLIELPIEMFSRNKPSLRGYLRECKNCWKPKQKAASAKWYAKNKEKASRLAKARQLKIKLEVFSHYSHGDIRCACCAEIYIEFLALDHINGGGNKHRKIVGTSVTYYSWLKRNGFPEGYRILCHNCNMATAHNRICPHKKELLK